MSDRMTFPDTVEEFMEKYKVVDIDGVYMSKGAELVPIFRMKQWFEQLPSAQPERRWIPVAEGLPHGSCQDLVNVSIHDDSGDTPFDYTSCGWVTTNGEYWIVDNEINNHVVAWMPLPEPYKII